MHAEEGPHLRRVSIERAWRVDWLTLPRPGLAFGYGQIRYHEAKGFLERTRQFRLQLARHQHAIDLRNALEDLPQRLRAIWTDPHRTRERNKREIFMEWLDTNNERGSGLAARRIIEGFIAKELGGAFTVEEIDRFNRGHLRRFDPYGNAPTVTKTPTVESWVE
jgi:hypothetical protein